MFFSFSFALLLSVSAMCMCGEAAEGFLTGFATRVLAGGTFGQDQIRYGIVIVRRIQAARPDGGGRGVQGGR